VSDDQKIFDDLERSVGQLEVALSRLNEKVESNFRSNLYKYALVVSTAIVIVLVLVC